MVRWLKILIKNKNTNNKKHPGEAEVATTVKKGFENTKETKNRGLGHRC